MGTTKVSLSICTMSTNRKVLGEKPAEWETIGNKKLELTTYLNSCCFGQVNIQMAQHEVGGWAIEELEVHAATRVNIIWILVTRVLKDQYMAQWLAVFPELAFVSTLSKSDPAAGSGGRTKIRIIPAIRGITFSAFRVQDCNEVCICVGFSDTHTTHIA
jgi:hypothetical protein